MKHHRAKDLAFLEAMRILYPLGVTEKPEEYEKAVGRTPKVLLEFFDSFEDALARLGIDPICHDVVYHTLIHRAVDVASLELTQEYESESDLTDKIISTKRLELMQRTMRAIGLEISNSLANEIDMEIRKMRDEFEQDDLGPPGE